MKVFLVSFRTPNGKEWCHIIANNRAEALSQVHGAYSAEETDLDPNNQGALNLPEWML